MVVSVLRLLGRKRCFMITVVLSLSLLSSACDGNGYSAASSTHPQLLYFMSFSCPGCRQVNPLLEELHRSSAGRYEVTARAFGSAPDKIASQQKQVGLTFPIAAATRQQALQDNVRVTPTVLLLHGGEVRERYQGTNGVARLKRLIESGALGRETGILELVRQPGPFGGKAITVRGQLLNKSKDSFIAGWVLSNGVESIHVEQMTLSQAAPPPTAEREPLSGELIGKELRMQGRLRMAGSVPILTVHQWEALP